MRPQAEPQVGHQHLGGEIAADLAKTAGIFRALAHIGGEALPGPAQSLERLSSPENFSHSNPGSSSPPPSRASRIRNSRSSVSRRFSQKPPAARAFSRRTVMLVASTGTRSQISAHSKRERRVSPPGSRHRGRRRDHALTAELKVATRPRSAANAASGAARRPGR